jgi:hypothetical protein
MVLSIIGIPNLWKVYLTFASGAFLVLVVSGPYILKHLGSKDKILKKKTQKETVKDTNTVYIDTKESILVNNLSKNKKSFNTEEMGYLKYEGDTAVKTVKKGRKVRVNS